MGVTVAPAQFDIDGVVLLNYIDSGADLFTVDRRVSRTATLDGGSIIDDLGFSDTDRTLSITANNVTKEQSIRLSYILRNYTLITIATDEAIFLCAPSSYSYSDGQASFVALVKQKLSA